MKIIAIAIAFVASAALANPTATTTTTTTTAPAAADAHSGHGKKAAKDTKKADAAAPTAVCSEADAAAGKCKPEMKK